MDEHFEKIILEATGAKELFEIEMIQSLWSGYGEIVRYGLGGCELERVVVKHVKLPIGGAHPRGWNTDLSHQRKVKSYQVETAWYEQWSACCGDGCRIPQCFAMESKGDEVLIVLEDLDASGYDGRKSSVSWTEILACLSWLAHFHATYMNEIPKNLWETGTYWHLETRPEELDALADITLKNAAPAIDLLLKESSFQTFVHGDAKLANFCFSADGSRVAAVDFQYIGGGCGMKDVAYFVGSCMGERECEKYEGDILDAYFGFLRTAIHASKASIDVDLLEKDWRSLYPVAWTDFHRFLKGWSPGHWKINSYSERIEREVIAKLCL